MRWLRGLIISLVSIVFLALLGVVILANTDLGRFKSQIEKFASDYLGRAVIVDGDLSIHVGRKIRLSATEARLASTSWTDHPDLLSVGSLTVAIDTASALRGFVAIDDIQADGVIVNLAVSEESENNFTLEPFASDDISSSAVSATGAAGVEDSTLDFLLKQARVSDLSITYTAAGSVPVSFTSPLVILSEKNGGAAIQLTGKLNDTEISAQGSAGTIEAIVDLENVNFDLTGTLGEISFKTRGQIDDLVSPDTPEFEVSVHGPNAEYLASILGVEPVTTGPLSFDISGKPAPEGLAFQVKGAYGEFDIALSGTMAGFQHYDELSAKINARGPNAAMVAELFGYEEFPALPFTVDADGTRSGEMLTVERFVIDVGPARLDITASIPHLPTLTGAQFNIDTHGPDFGHFNKLFGFPGKLTGPFEIHASLGESADNNGALKAMLTSQHLNLNIEGTLTPEPDLAGSRLAISLTGPSVSTVAHAFGIEGMPSESFSASADVRIADQQAAITDGKAILSGDTATFDGTLDFDPLSVLNLRAGVDVSDGATTLRSFGVDADGIPAGRWQIDAGITQADDVYVVNQFVARSDYAQITVSGSVGKSLGGETIDLDIRTSGASLAALLSTIAPEAPDEPFDVTGKLQFPDNQTLALTGVNASLGGSNGQADLNFSLSPLFGSGTLALDASGPSLKAHLTTAESYLPEPDAFAIRGHLRWDADSLQLVDLAASLHDATLNVSGEMQPPPAVAFKSLSVTVHLPSLKWLQFLTDQALPDTPVSGSAIIGATATTMQTRELKLRVGDSDISGTASYLSATDDGGVPTFAIDLHSDHLDLSPLMRTDEELLDESQPSESDRFIPDIAMPLKSLKAVNGSFDATASRLVLQNENFTDVTLRGTLDDGALRVHDFSLTGYRGGAVAGQVDVIPSKTGADVSLNLNGTDLTVGLPFEDEAQIPLLPKYSFTTRLKGSGSTLRELAGTSNGYLRLTGGEGQLAISEIAFLTRDFASEVLNTVNPFVKNEPLSQVQCTAVLLEIVDGIVFGDPALAFQSDKLNISAIAKIDLATEKLNATINSQARTGLGIGFGGLVSPYTEVAGTLMNPTLRLNSKGVLTEGSVAVATVGISILAKKATQRLFSEKDPCGKAIIEADADLESRNPPNTNSEH